MSLTFQPGGYTLVVNTNADSPYFGGSRFIGQSVESEIYTHSFPPSSGILETDAGDRFFHLVFRCDWVTTNPDLVDRTLEILRGSKIYGTVTHSDGVGGTLSYPFVRLDRIDSVGPRTTGIQSVGVGRDLVVHMSKDLIFKGVR